MGEEQSGVDAIRTAFARISHGQCEAMLVGGAFNAERRDMLLLMEAGGVLSHGAFQPVFARRGESSGMILGSMAAFLHLETRASAEARGAKIHACIAGIASDQCRRDAHGQVAASLMAVIKKAGISDKMMATSSGACVAAEEKQAMDTVSPGAHLVAVGDFIGHGR